MADPKDNRGPIDQGLELGDGVDELELKQIIQRELDQALGIEGSKLSSDRRTLLEYYEGEPFGNEDDGRSQVVMRSVLETVEWVLPALLRIFTASDKLVAYEPTLERDEGAADQATSYGNFIVYRDNDGFMALYDWMKDALIQKLGWVKVYWDTQEEQQTNTYTGLTEAEYKALLGPDIEVLEENSYPAPQAQGFGEDAPDPSAAGGLLYDCKLRSTRSEGRVRIENVPPEEVLVSRRAKRGSLPFVCHRRERRYSDLVEDGYDKDALDLLPSYDAPQYNTERLARYEDEDDWPYQTERTDKAMRDIWVEENYLRVDLDGDGRAELVKVVTSGDGLIILTKDGEPDIEPIDEVPLISLCPIPMPHKLVGLSVADLVTDLQLIRSVLIRQMLDNLYLTNNPRHAIEDDAATDETYDDLLTSRPGGIVRLKKVAGLQTLVTPFVAEKTLDVVQYFDEVAEVRSGISRHNQGLNPDDLNKTATGVNLIQQAAAQRVELIARIFAETGIKELGRKILGMVTKFQQRERVIRLTGEWVTMDPRQWQNSMEVTVSVGLGTGNRDQIIQHLMQLLQIQQAIIPLQGGISGPLVYGKNIYDVLERLTENAGFKEAFFADPTQPPPAGMAGPPQQPKPDPQVMQAQAKIALQQQQAEIEQQNDAARLQADLAGQRQKAELEMQLARERAALEMSIERDRANHEMQLAAMRARAGAYTAGPENGATV